MAAEKTQITIKACKIGITVLKMRFGDVVSSDDGQFDTVSFLLRHVVRWNEYIV